MSKFRDTNERKNCQSDQSRIKTHDFMDDIVNLEGIAFEQGLQLGKEAALSGDMRMQGQRGGFNKAYPIAMELGFIEASEKYAEKYPSALSHIKSVEDFASNSELGLASGDSTTSNETYSGAAVPLLLDDDSGGGPSTAFLSKRSQKRKEAILTKIQTIPNEYCPTIDYEKELQELR